MNSTLNEEYMIENATISVLRMVLVPENWGDENITLGMYMTIKKGSPFSNETVIISL